MSAKEAAAISKVRPILQRASRAVSEIFQRSQDLLKISINKNIKGTATMPLTSADQNSARIGSNPRRFKQTPSIVANAMT